jgi:hypothetical protein
MPDERPHPEDTDKDKEYPVTITFRMASFILNCTSFLVNNSRGEVEDTMQSFELAMNDLRTMGPAKYNEMMEKVVDILKTDPKWEENLRVFRGEDQPVAQTKTPPPRVIMPGSKLIQ